MENSFVSQQYENEEDAVEKEQAYEEPVAYDSPAIVYDENGQFYDENGYLCDEYGYYDEEGVYHTYESNDAEVSEVYHNGKNMLVDKCGRILSETKIAEADPNLPEAYEVFVSVFQPQRLASVMDADSASLCVWCVGAAHSI
jgi:hypothetical protein